MKFRKIIGVILLLLSFCLIGSGAFLMINGNRIKFANALKRATKNIVEDVNTFKSFFVLDDYVTDKTNNKISTKNTIKAFDYMYTLEGDVYTKANSKTDFYADMMLKYGSNKLDFAILLRDAKLNLKFKEVVDKFYYTDFDVANTTSELTMEDLAILKDYFLDATFKVLKKNAVGSEKIDLSLGGIVFKTEKLSMSITEKNANEILIEFLKKINNDAKYKDLFNSAGSTVEDAIKEAESDTDLSDKVILQYNIYLDGKENILRHEMIDEDDAVVLIDSYKDKDGRAQFAFTFKEEGKEILSFEIKGIDANQSVITGKIDGEPIITGSYIRTESRIDLELALTIENETIKLEYSFERVEKDKEYKMTFKIDFMVGVFEMENIITLGAQFPDVSTEGAIKIEEITEEDANRLMELIQRLIPEEFGESIPLV